MTEPTPIRNVGPYQSVEEVRAQIHAQHHGIPHPYTRDAVIQRNAMLIAEGRVLAGIYSTDDNTEYEAGIISFLAAEVDAETCQVIAGWLIRAWKAGYRVGHGDGTNGGTSPEFDRIGNGTQTATNGVSYADVVHATQKFYEGRESALDEVLGEMKRFEGGTAPWTSLRTRVDKMRTEATEAFQNTPANVGDIFDKEGWPR